MARKSKGKFNMKGHSIPGIKGYKTTTLEDGRAASSAFQMQSPLHVEDDGSDAYKLKDINVTSSDYDPNRATVQRADQSGVNYALQQLGRLAGRLKDGEAAKEDEITEQVNKYEVTGDAVDATNPEFQSSIDDQFLTDEELAKRNVDKMDEEFQANVPKVNLEKEITLPEVESKKPDYSEATKNEMTDIRREFKDDGSWDPRNNPEHADIQNKINELYGSSTRY